MTELPFAPQLVTCDVSFIGVVDRLAAGARARSGGLQVLALVKPQFEAGRADAPKGVVRDAEVRKRVVRQVAEASLQWSARVAGVVDSGFPARRETVSSSSTSSTPAPELPAELDRWIADAAPWADRGRHPLERRLP